MNPRADFATHPHTYGFQHARPERLANHWLPDAVTDTTAKRQRRADRLLGDGGGLLPRLWALPGHQLWHVVLPLKRGLNFYADARRAGQAELRHHLPHAPALAQVALGRHLQLHVHALVALPEGQAPPRLGRFGAVVSTPVNGAEYLRNLALYFSRPADERAARPDLKDQQRFSPAQLRQQRLAAAELYLEARTQIGRLPRRRWTQNTSRPRDVGWGIQAVPATPAPRFQPAPAAGSRVNLSLSLSQLALILILILRLCLGLSGWSLLTARQIHAQGWLSLCCLDQRGSAIWCPGEEQARAPPRLRRCCGSGRSRSPPQTTRPNGTRPPHKRL